MTKLLLVDCDGSIRFPISDSKFISHPKDQQIVPGADRALAHYFKQGWTIIGITNQGGCAAGYKTLEDAILEQKYTLELFPELGRILFCPDFTGKQCWVVGDDLPDALAFHEDAWAHDLIGTFRKPGSGMLDAAILMYGDGEDRSELWYIGDRTEDEQAAAAAGVNFLHADIWRGRFLPGVHEFHNLTPLQVGFLEGIEI